MNERIYELAEQAGAYCEVLRGGDYKPPVLDGMNLEKFAELIVLKCAEIADTAEPFLASDLIKQHFGIEERKGWVCPKCGVDRTQDVCPKGHTAAVTGDCPMTATAQTQVEV